MQVERFEYIIPGEVIFASALKIVLDTIWHSLTSFAFALHSISKIWRILWILRLNAECASGIFSSFGLDLDIILTYLSKFL